MPYKTGIVSPKRGSFGMELKLKRNKTLEEKIRWKTITYPSGTHIVTTEDDNKPHYYVYGDERYQICKELEKWLNNGTIPSWAKSLKRKSNISCTGDKGIYIYTTGPMILPPDDNGALNWQIDPTKEREREELIDNILPKHNI